MSLYELFSTFAALPKKDGQHRTIHVSDDEFAAGMELLRKVAERDPTVKI